MSEETPRFKIVPVEQDPITVVDLSTGEEVHRPDIAAKALGIFGQAIESAGGELVVPDDISELFPEPGADES